MGDQHHRTVRPAALDPAASEAGVGTVANILLVGTSIQLALGVLPHPDVLWLQVLMLVAGVVIVAFASGLYIGAHFGPGRETD